MSIRRGAMVERNRLKGPCVDSVQYAGLVLQLSHRARSSS